MATKDATPSRSGMTTRLTGRASAFAGDPSRDRVELALLARRKNLLVARLDLLNALGLVVCDPVSLLVSVCEWFSLQHHLPELLMLEETAQALRVSRTTIHRTIRRGDLDVVRLGQRERATVRVRAETCAGPAPHAPRRYCRPRVASCPRSLRSASQRVRRDVGCRLGGKRRPRRARGRAGTTRRLGAE